MNLNPILVMWHTDELFGPTYGLRAARADSAAALLASHNRRHIIRKSPHCKHCTMRKLPPHIILPLNDPWPECMKCEGSGTYHCGPFQSIPCPCRYLQREPTIEEINSEKQASL